MKHLLEAPEKITEVLLTEDDLARAMGLTVTSIRRWRLRRTGPKATKFGTSKRAVVRYRPKDVKAWLDSQPVIGEDPRSK